MFLDLNSQHQNQSHSNAFLRACIGISLVFSRLWQRLPLFPVACTEQYRVFDTIPVCCFFFQLYAFNDWFLGLKFELL